jgi:hypothetical protein
MSFFKSIHHFAVTLILFSGSCLYAQTDSLVFNEDNVLTGEIKTLNRGVLTIETKYSDSDFNIEWVNVKGIYTERLFTINLTDRSLLTDARMRSISADSVEITTALFFRTVALEDIVYFRQVKKTFWDRLSASLDLGFSLTKANSLKQYNASVNLGYKTERWTFNGSYRQVLSDQDDIEPTERTDGSVTADYMLRNGIFFGASLNFLSNTEQRLDLRTTGGLGAGYYFIRNNHMYWNGFLGVAINNEDFAETPEEPSADRESYEGIVGTELNLYDVGDLNLMTNTYWYPSFTEAGRNRVDFRFDLSYDLPRDFYVKTGLTVNYDSKPAPGASDTDYVIVTGFGWEL